MTIKAVVFDLGGLIVEFDYTKFFNEVIVPSPLFKPDSFIFLEFWRESDTYHQGRLTNEEFFHQTCELLQICYLEQEHFFDVFNTVISHPNEDVVKLIKTLKDNNAVKLIMLSNINEAHWKYLTEQKWDFLDYFDDFLLSHQLKLLKPDPKIFDHVVQKAGCKPEEILYVDDGLNNIRAAKEQGIIGIAFSDIKKLKEEFKKNDLLLE